MPRKIEIKWHCPTCKAINPKVVTKPGIFTRALLLVTCPKCLSNGELIMTKERGQTGRVGLDILIWKTNEQIAPA